MALYYTDFVNFNWYSTGEKSVPLLSLLRILLNWGQEICYFFSTSLFFLTSLNSYFL